MRWIQDKPTSAAKDEGYNDGWLGLENLNQYPIGTEKYREYNYGYVQGNLDAEELLSYKEEARYHHDVEDYDV